MEERQCLRNFHATFLDVPCLVFLVSEAVHEDELFDAEEFTLHLAFTVLMAVRILESYSYLLLALLPRLANNILRVVRYEKSRTDSLVTSMRISSTSSKDPLSPGLTSCM
jgi:hypothetical protein